MSVIIMIIGLIFTKILLPLPMNITFQDHHLDPDELAGNGSINTIQRLVNHPTPLLNQTAKDYLDSSYSTQESAIMPSFEIGNQIGIGGGVYEAYDSANLTSSVSLDVDDNHWRARPEEHENSLTVSIPSGYTNQSGYFNISGVTALPDWRLVENATTGATSRQSDSFFEGAQEFTINETDFNITKVYVYIDMVDNDGGDSQKPTGEFLVLGDNSGEPNSTDVKGFFSLETHPTLAGLTDGASWIASSNGWLEYTFSPAIHLTKGTYWLTFNDTIRDNGVGFWRWYTQSEGSGNPDKGEWNYKIALPNWFEWTGVDMVIMPQVLPVELVNSNYLNKKYTSPKSVEFLYQTSIDSTDLSTFTWFEWNGTSDNIHYFSTNTSVNFTIRWIINITDSNNPLPITASYLTVNNSISQWNLTFTTSSITTSYDIRNRLLTVNGLESDWNGSSISHGGSLEYNITPSGGLNTSVIYSNQSTQMIINASTLAVATDWNITFDAPNYILEFNISLGGTTLELPYQTFTMNDYSLDFEVIEIGNLTYWIDYPDGSQVLQKNNIDDSQTIITDIWAINSTLDQTTNINGTYSLQAFWNNLEKSKVGTFTRIVNMIVNSTFDFGYEAEVILDTHLDIVVYYNSTHNATVINNAILTGVPSWGATPLIDFNHTAAQGPYTFSIEVNDSQHNPGDIISIDISAELPGFVGHSTTVYVKVVSDTLLSINTSQELVLEWRENITIEIQYNDTGGSGIGAATIAVDGDSANVFNVANIYYYRFNSTNPKYGGVSSHLNLNITASHSNYLTRIWFFNLTINLGRTNISAIIDGNGAVYNDTLGTQIYYADSSADHVSILLRYYHKMTNENLSTFATIGIDPIPIIPILNSEEAADSTWNITFDPDQEAIYRIEITFSLTNYEDATFIFRLEVLKARTRLQTAYQNDTNVYYAEYYDFSLFFNNTDWNENITFNGEGPIAINDTNKVQFLNRTGDLFWFRFAYNTNFVGIITHSIELTFILTNFESSSLNVIFNVVKSPFIDLDAFDVIDEIPCTNGTIYIRHFSPNEFDEFSISLSYYTNKTGRILISTPNIACDLTIWIGQVEQANHNWTFIFNGSAVGTFLINISFSHENYSSLTFTIQYVIQPADSSITDYSPNIIGTPNATIDSGDFCDFWLVWKSEYSENLNDSDGVMINDSSMIFISSDPSNGTHYFRFSASDVNDYIISVIFETNLYTPLEIILHFRVGNRTLIINNALSTHPNNWLSEVGFLQYGDIYYFHIVINDSETNNGVNISTFSWLPTNVSFVNVSSGDHLFTYRADIIATTTSVLISIPFKLSNYADASYNIRFYVKVAESRLVSVPSTITTYYSQDTNFSLIWQTESNPNAPFSPVLRINSSRIITSSPCLFDNITNGNYSFTVSANQAGTYIVTFNFWASRFENQSTVITIIILPLPTELYLVSLANNTIIGQISPFYFSDQYNISLTWFDSINFIGIRDFSPDYFGNGSTMLSFSTSFNNGTHNFIIEGNSLGFFQVIIVFEIPNHVTLRYSVFINVSIMPTSALDITNFTYNHSIIVEDIFSITGNESYQTFRGTFVPNTFSFNVKMNGTSVGFDVERDENWFRITFSTADNPYGDYNLTIQVSLTGYQSQIISLNLTLQGRETILTVTLPGKSLAQGEAIKISVLLNYTQLTNGGSGSEILLASLENVNISFYIELKTNEDIIKVTGSSLTDVLGEATFQISGDLTASALGFANITVWSDRSSSGLPSRYSIPAAELAQYKIVQIFDPLEIIIPVVTIGVTLLLVVGAVVASSVVVNRRRKRRRASIQARRRKIEQSFEDIKSIRLLIARHESGLQFYSEKTIAELQTDTDALSGMSAALSTFMEEVSDGMRSRTEEQKEKEKIEVMSREGLHMLIWHGKFSSFIIISEIRLPDYFQERLANLGREVEAKFANDLQDFYRSDQVPSNQIKKMVRKHIPLHYFSAFILNEGVLTLESIKLSRKEMKMLKLIKEIRFQKEGVHFFFSEQIISHLSRHFKRSEAIKFLDRAIEINLLIEASQEDILRITK